jgi:hypothetical protein
LNATHVENEVWGELWISLASLLRSYTALHGMIASKQVTVEQDEHRILVRCGTNWLELERNGAVIQGRRADGRNGTMEFTETGRLRSGLNVEEEQGEEEMDMTAESWARDLMQELPQ